MFKLGMWLLYLTQFTDINNIYSIICLAFIAADEAVQMKSPPYKAELQN